MSETVEREGEGMTPKDLLAEIDRQTAEMDRRARIFQDAETEADRRIAAMPWWRRRRMDEVDRLVLRNEIVHELAVSSGDFALARRASAFLLRYS